MDRKLIRIAKIVITAIVVFSVGLFLWHTDFAAVWAQLGAIGGYFYGILFITLAAYFLGTWSWKLCLGSASSKMNIFQLFAVRQVCETVGLFNPTNVVGGDLLKIHYLRKFGVDQENAVTSVAISRITIMLSQVLLFVMSCAWLLATQQLLGRGAHVALVGTVVLLLGAKILLLYWIGRKGEIPSIAGGEEANGFGRVVTKIKRWANEVRTHYQQDKKAFWLSYVLALSHWIVGSVEFFLILVALGYDVTVMHGALLDMAVIVFKSMGAFIPGQLGVEELGNKLMLAAVGIGSATVWVTVSLLRRARQIFWVACGLVLYFFVNRSFRHVAPTQA